jgi:hypothetical protein
MYAGSRQGTKISGQWARREREAAEKLIWTLLGLIPCMYRYITHTHIHVCRISTRHKDFWPMSKKGKRGCWKAYMNVTRTDSLHVWTRFEAGPSFFLIIQINWPWPWWTPQIAILMMTEGSFQALQPFSSSKMVLHTVESCSRSRSRFVALNYWLYILLWDLAQNPAVNCMYDVSTFRSSTYSFLHFYFRSILYAK